MSDTDPGAPPAYFIRGQKLTAPRLAPGLYLVATPIGHLGDVTLRALDTLAAADLVACEDTRVTRKLLARYGIDRPLMAYHEHSGPEARRRILAALAAGQAVALASDAGTPLISDPGYQLVQEALAAGGTIVPVPGASAVMAALAAAGLPTDTFLFGGFLPAKAAARASRLQELAAVPASLVFFESPRRLRTALADAARILGGGRGAVVCREMTKLHETFERGSLAELAERFAGAAPKGEIVVVVAPPEEGRAEISQADLDGRLAEALAGHSIRDASDRVAAETGLPRRTVYQRALALKGEGGR
ncbi:MAG TPA: 16S rRNA (cytidine(1402)-2'-O)-methyltransferase [Afifellaceae bacterium]|nr:16S rRNA (cytidine(1402)-2'-O)-methyltransferase [Afifellaceae bacterium]